MPVRVLGAVADAVEATLIVQIRWRGGELDRLLDERHAAVVGTMTALLRVAGWSVAVEVTYSRYGERGSVDVLGWHESSRTLTRVFVVGTGGARLRDFETPLPGSEVRDAGTYGVIRLVLRKDGYDWRFLPVAAGEVTDSGNGACH